MVSQLAHLINYLRVRLYFSRAFACISSLHPNIFFYMIVQMFLILLRHVFFSDEEWKQSDYIKDVLNCSSRIIYDICSNFFFFWVTSCSCSWWQLCDNIIVLMLICYECWIAEVFYFLSFTLTSTVIQKHKICQPNIGRIYAATFEASSSDSPWIEQLT